MSLDQGRNHASRAGSRRDSGDRKLSPAARPAARKGVALVFALVLACDPGMGLASSAQAMPVQFFYVPFPEDQLLTCLHGGRTRGPSNAPAEPITSYITITAVADDTIIYYDQWENGYDIDIANTLDIYSATQPGRHADLGRRQRGQRRSSGVPTDIINAGTVIDLHNDVATTTRQAVIDFDGGDKVAATKTIAMTRTSWAGGLGHPARRLAWRCSTPTTGAPTSALR